MNPHDGYYIFDSHDDIAPFRDAETWRSAATYRADRRYTHFLCAQDARDWLHDAFPHADWMLVVDASDLEALLAAMQARAALDPDGV